MKQSTEFRRMGHKIPHCKGLPNTQHNRYQYLHPKGHHHENSEYIYQRKDSTSFQREKKTKQTGHIQRIKNLNEFLRSVRSHVTFLRNPQKDVPYQKEEGIGYRKQEIQSGRKLKGLPKKIAVLGSQSITNIFRDDLDSSGNLDLNY